MARKSTNQGGKRNLAGLLCAAALALAACASAAAKEPKHVFETTFKDPDAQPMHLKGTKVVAAVMMQDPAARRKAEDALAGEITALGGLGIPMYTLSLANTPDKEGESKTRAAVEAAGAKGLVVMRPIDVRHKATQTDVIASNDMYGGYWGGYYGVGWADPWVDKAPDVQTDIVVTVETFVFSLPQNKLVWTGTSETTNPKNAAKLVHQLATDGVKELQKLGLLVAQ